MKIFFFINFFFLLGTTLISSLMTYHRVCNKSSTTGIAHGTGTAYPSWAPEFTSGFEWSSCYSIFSFMCIFWRSLSVLFLLAIVSSVLLRFTHSDYPLPPLVTSNTSLGGIILTPNQRVFLLLVNAACLAKKKNIVQLLLSLVLTECVHEENTEYICTNDEENTE